MEGSGEAATDLSGWGERECALVAEVGNIRVVCSSEGGVFRHCVVAPSVVDSFYSIREEMAQYGMAIARRSLDSIE